MVLDPDAESGTHRSSIGNSRGRTNHCRLSPVSRLPIELLGTIFELCVLDHHSGSNSIFSREVPSWINVSYVCRHWREVALDCSALWAYHFVVSLRWTEELLARSKQAPLKVELAFVHPESDSWWWNPVEKLMYHTERFEELRLVLSDDCHLVHALSSSAPLLRDLKIEALPSFGLPRVFDSFLPFRGDTPALRRLVVAECPVPWYSFKFSSLTTLELFGLPEEIQQDIAEFLPMLRGMQQLTRLYLHEALQVASAAGFISSVAFRTFQKIELPRLAHFLICSSLSMVIALLACVNIPSNALLRLECFSEDVSSIDDFTLLSSVLAQRFNISEVQASSSSTIKTLFIDFTTRTSIFFRDDFDPEPDNQGFEAFFTLIIDWSRSTILFDEDVRLACDICCPIALTNVQVIRVVDSPPSPLFWGKLLKDCPCLRSIQLHDGCMPDLASLLSVSDPAAHSDLDNRTRDDVLVPDLEELELFDMEFSEEGDPDRPPRRAVTLRRLLDALATRCISHGRLTLTDCLTWRSSLEVVCSWGNGDIHMEKYICKQDDSGDDSEDGDTGGGSWEARLKGFKG